MEEDQKKLAEELLFSGEEKPSFAKMLYFGTFNASQVFPFPEDRDAKTNDFLAKVKEFAEKYIDGAAIDRNASIPDTVIQGLADLGVLGMTVPREYGGLGMSQQAYCQVTELLSRYCGSTALFVNVHQSIGLKSLLLFGTDKQKKEWLPLLARGEKFAAFSLTEPNAGSDASGIETRAVYDAERDVYHITGKKQWTTNGSIADVLTVMARTEVDTPEGKKDKITAFLVTPDMPGFKVTAPALEKVGMRGTKTANLAFDKVAVPAENILGPIGGGLKVCLTVLDYGRTTFGSTCTGTAKDLVERAIAHACARHQFNRPLASFALVKKKIAMMSAFAYAMDATTTLTACLVDSGMNEFMLESAMLKVFASDTQWKILYDTMQILGGRSFFTDQPYERMMRDARLNMIGEGSNEVMRAFIGVVGLRDVGMQLKAGVESLSNPFSRPLWLFVKQLTSRLRTPKIPVKSALIKKEAKALGKAIRRFGIANIRLLAHYREDIIEKQLQLDRIATIGMALYTTTAVLSKLDRELEENIATEDAVSAAKLYCEYSMKLIDRCFASMDKNNDETIESVSDQISGVKYP